ncbi:MAG: hypothetical protein AABY17_02310 [Thermoproteota archaeon]
MLIAFASVIKSSWQIQGKWTPDYSNYLNKLKTRTNPKSKLFIGEKRDTSC